MLVAYSRGLKNRKGDFPYLDRYFCNRTGNDIYSGQFTETDRIVICDGVSRSPENPEQLVGYATRMLVKYMSGRFFGLLGKRHTASRLAKAIEDVNDDVFEKLKMAMIPFAATTALTCYYDGRNLCYAWAGNSRLYKISENGIEQLTQDHVKEDGKSLLKAIGGPPIKADKGFVKVNEGDIFIACTDGLFENLDNGSISEIVIEKEIKTAVDALMEEAAGKGTIDDITVVGFCKKIS